MMKKYLLGTLILASNFLLASPPIINGDFEEGANGSTNIEGWNGGPIWFSSYYANYHGNRYAYINSSSSVVTQTFENITPNTQYEIRFLAACGISGCYQQNVSLYDDTGVKVSTSITNAVKKLSPIPGLQEYSLKIKTGANATKLTISLDAGESLLVIKKTLLVDYIRFIDSYCESNHLEEGFQVVDPDGDDDKNSFEIFCYKDSDGIMHDLISLPIKNDSNNFVFENNTTTTNYYNSEDNPRKHFHAIEVGVNNIQYEGTLASGAPKPSFPVILGNQRDPQEIITDGKTYNLMRSTFSNINLIGTPFEIDWSNSSVNECNSESLRKALNQAVKYNTLLQDNKAICHTERLRFSLQYRYRFLKYLGSEVLTKSCKDMAEFVPDNLGILDDSSIAGYFNIDPFQKGRDSKDIGEKGRPITVWCKYQEDLGWVWTFLTALDAKVTNSKIDLMNKEDTCSELGLYFFVPNTKETFDRVRRYLKDHKSGDAGWENYTGTIREKYKAYTNNPDKEYYVRNVGYELIWPYGPLGIYYPCDGHKDATNGCSDNRWYPGQTNVRGWMSGSPMHNISTMANYSDSMGAKGWVSILGEQDLNITNDWWVSDIGAGEEIGRGDPSEYQYFPHGIHKYQSEGYKYYEPNGNYKKYAWLNFVHDSEGWIYHNDDNNDFYAYYDYLCMSDTNYDVTKRYSLVPGFFNAIERGTTANNTAPNFDDYQIRTKIVSRDINLDIILYKFDPNTGDINRNELEKTEKKSVGVFLSTFTDKRELKLLRFLGEIKDFDQNEGRIQLAPFTLNSAVKEAYIHFYYCNPADMDWKECWNYNGSLEYPVVQKRNDLAGESDSYDTFAIRPKEFQITTDLPLNNNETFITAARDFNITFKALDDINNTTSNYNEQLQDVNSSFVVSYTEENPSCIIGTFNPAIDNNWSFKDGVYKLSTNYSEVGKVTITIQENVGKEFAIVDSDDTPLNDRLIKDTNFTINFTPDHFEVNATLENGANGFTYVSKDLNMAAIINAVISAKNEKNETTQNYNSLCYAQNTTIETDISYTPETLTPNSFENIIYNVYYDNDKKLVEESNTSLSSMVIPISKEVFSDTNKGTANIKINFNYPRKYNEPVNPFDINITNFAISDSNNIEGKKENLGGIRFYYAKTKSTKDFYDDVSTDSVNTPIEITVFCNLDLENCKKYGIDTLKGMTNEYNWWLNSLHNANLGDGKVLLETDNSSVLVHPSEVSNFIEGVDSNVTVSVESVNTLFNVGSTTQFTRPTTVKIKPTQTMKDNYNYLLFNKDFNLYPEYIYKVRFVAPQSAWSGEGKTGYTIEENSSGKKTYRIEW